MLSNLKMNKPAAASGSYLEPEEQPVFSYNYRDYPKNPQPRTGYLHLSQSIEEEPDENVTINTQGTGSVADKSIIDVSLRIKPSKSKSNPFNENVLEVQDNNSVVFKQSKDMKGNVNDTCNIYKFSNIYGPHVTQSEIFKNIVHDMLCRYLNGEDVLLFSFGTTNSGKTFTIQGPTENPGIIPRTLNILFNSLAPYLDTKSELMFRPTYAHNVSILTEEDRAESLELKRKILQSFDQTNPFSTFTSSYHTAVDDSTRMFRSLDREHTAFTLNNCEPYHVSVWISFYEVYNENVHDLLDVSSLKPCTKKKTILKIGRDRDQNVYIKDLIYINVHSCEEAYRVLRFGMSNLSVASTELNNKSSRSHCVFSIKLVKVCRTNQELEILSSFEICDLAGAERQKRAHTSGDRLREARTINSSLHVLARCFQMLRENSALPKEKKKLVPFRDSKLTQIFQRSLQGSNAVKMIVNVNASPSYAEETMQVLKISAVARELLTVVKPQRHIVPPRRKTRFSMMASRNIDWQETELLDFDQVTGYNPFQSTVEQDQSYETIRALECKLEEVLRENQDLKETAEMMRNLMEKIRKDAKDAKNKEKENFDKELERHKSYFRKDKETLVAMLMQYKEALKEMEADESLDDSTTESQQKVIITGLRQELREANVQLQNLTELHDELNRKVTELSTEKSELESKNEALESEVKELTRKLEEIQNEQTKVYGESHQVKYLTNLLDEAKQDFKEQATEIDNLRFELDEMKHENGKLEMKNTELEEQLVDRDDIITMKTDITEELQEKLDYMENRFQSVSLEHERLLSDKDNMIIELRSQLSSKPDPQSNSDEIVLQKEIKTLSSLLVDKDKTISDLKSKLHKYEHHYLALKEDRKIKEKDLAEMKPKCEELTQKVVKLESDCTMYMNTINQMENDNQSTKRNQEKLLKIYEDRLKSAQNELAQLKTSQLSTELSEVSAIPSGKVATLLTKVRDLEQELVQRNNIVRDLQLSVIEKGEVINKLKEQLEKSHRSPLRGLENRMSEVNLHSPEEDVDDDPDFLPNTKCKSTTKKKRLPKKKEPFSLNKTTGNSLALKLSSVATPRRKLFNNSDTSEGLKTPEDMSPVTAVVPSPKSQIKNKLRGRAKVATKNIK